MDCIPFNRPTIVGTELHYISRALHYGHSAGDGEYTKKCQLLLEQTLGARKVLLTTSCTDALEMAALLLDIRPGDEVIVPSFTFVSTANAFVLRGAKPIFADIRFDTFNLDERHLEALITRKTRAIIPVHYAGVGCEMDAIGNIATRHGIAVVEDNAHGLFGKYKGRLLGTFGTMATQSFHETKNLICGEGGALVVNDAKHIGRAEILREKGTNRSRYFRGEVDKYTWVDIGSSYLPSDLLAAFLFAQLEAFMEIQERRRQMWMQYHHGLQSWAAENSVGLPYVPLHCEQPFHMFYLLLPTRDARTKMITHLKRRGIMAVFHYIPLHASPMGISLGGRIGSCPVAEDVSQRIVRLPFYNSLSSDEQARVIDAVKECPVHVHSGPDVRAAAYTD